MENIIETDILVIGGGMGRGRIRRSFQKNRP